MKMIRILEISHSKSRNSGTNLEKTWVFTISSKYLHIYEINNSKKHPQKDYENESCNDVDFINFRQNNCIFT